MGFEGRFTEIVIIFVVALIVLGPEKLPRVVTEVGRWVGRARAMARQFREQLEEEVNLEETRKQAKAASPAAAPSAASTPSPEPSAAEPAPPFDIASVLNPTAAGPEAVATTAEPHSSSEAHPETALFNPSSAADLQVPPYEGSSNGSTAPYTDGTHTEAVHAEPQRSPEPAHPREEATVAAAHPVTGESERT